MGNFELMFACQMGDGSVLLFTRVVALSDLSMALRVGSSMVGEEVAVGQRLDLFVHAIPTERPPTMDAHLVPLVTVWARVLHILHIDTASVKFVYSYRNGLRQNPRGHQVSHAVDYEEPEICGFFVWPFVD